MVEFTVNMFTYVANCQPLDDIINGSIACSLTPSNENICNITCNKGYVLIGSDTRTCLINGSWSGTDSSCQLGNSNNNYCYILQQFYSHESTVLLKDSITLAHSSQTTTYIDTLCSMHFSHTLLFIVHRTLNRYYLILLDITCRCME